MVSWFITLIAMMHKLPQGLVAATISFLRHYYVVFWRPHHRVWHRVFYNNITDRIILIHLQKLIVRILNYSIIEYHIYLNTFFPIGQSFCSDSTLFGCSVFVVPVGWYWKSTGKVWSTCGPVVGHKKICLVLQWQKLCLVASSSDNTHS